MKELVSLLTELREEVLIFPNKDLLVNINSKKAYKLHDSTEKCNPELKRIIREAVAIEKTSGINPICISEGVIQLKLNSKDTYTPIFLTPVEIQLDTLNDTFKMLKLAEKKMVNPFLINHFKISSESEGFISDFESLRRVLNINPETRIENLNFIGNFHPKRFSFLREIEDLIVEENGFSYALKAIYGNDPAGQNVQLSSKTPLFRNDEDQFNVYQKIDEGSIVIQGPPGTGKSQVIGNLIGNILDSNQTVLLISEKKVALDVIQNKLNTKGLGLLSFQIPSRYPSRALIFELKNCWDYFNQLKTKPTPQYFKNLDKQKILFDLFTIESKKQGCTPSYLIKLIETYSNADMEFTNECEITVSIFESSLEIISQIPNNLLPLVKFFKPKLIKEEFLKFTKDINEVIDTLNQIKFSREIEEWEEMQLELYTLLQYHTFQNKLYKKFGHLIEENKHDFISLKKQFYSIERALKVLESNQQQWLREPSIEELEFLKDLFTKKHLLKYKIQWIFTWRKWSRTPGVSPEIQIKNRIQYNKKVKQREAVLNKLFQLGIQEVDTELSLVTSLIENTDLTLWKKFVLENGKIANEINHQVLYRTMDFLKHSFHFHPKDRPLDVLKNISSKKEELLSAWPNLILLPSAIFPFLRDDISSFKTDTQQSIVRQIIFRNPELKRFTIGRFIEECTSICSSFEKESLLYADHLIMKQYDLFQQFEDLTKTPPRKLNEEQKEFRAKLKKGKSILVKEFGKKRAHRTIRNLFNSEAFLWIKVLKPIWMSNPNALSDCIPLKKELFDYLIADEASQLLLSHSVGALQRGKKAIICGDPQQMSPSSFFKKKQTLEIDLLHHANYYLKNIFLSNHYRSVHPKLIAFSNTYFYDNRLKAFQDTKAIDNPIIHHYVEEGQYHERKNSLEAEKVAELITKHISSKEKLGIVAFSETQLDCIYHSLSDDIKALLEQRIENDTLFFQSLEKVQGDECDRLIISFAYAYNTENKFEMRFGPINFHQGHKRLNVLFSRAKRNIDFFSSIKYKDFPMTENSGVTHMKKWFYLLESENPKPELNPNISIYAVLNDCGGFNDLISYLHVYSNRGYRLTH